MWAAVGIIHDSSKASSLTKSPKGHNEPSEKKELRWQGDRQERFHVIIKDKNDRKSNLWR